MKQIPRLLFWISERGEYFLAAFGVALATWMANYVFRLDLTRALTDQSAHLNFARLTIDSATPGISQLGFWPPLLHILLVPITGMVESLYRSGLAGFVVLLPFFILGSIFLYRTLLLITKQKLLSLTGAITFLTSPYVLYYSVTPMMEVLFLANLMGVVYFFTRWFYEQKIHLLIWAAAFVVLATLSRYEGFILIPIGAFLVWFFLWRQKKQSEEIEAALVLFLFLASWGVLAIGLYGWIYGGTPFAFMGGWWIRDSEYFPTQYNIFASLRYALNASFYVIGKPLVLFSVIGLPALFVLARKNTVAIAVLLLSVSPFFMIVISLFRGYPPIMVPDLPPFGLFFNERYGLTWIGFAIAFPLVLASFFSQYLSRISPFLARSFTSVVCIAFLSFSIAHFHQKVFTEEFREIRMNLGVDGTDQDELTRILSVRYDYGKILITRTINDGLVNELGIPLKNFIFEANNLLYQQTMEEPWLFARWVVMAKEQEPISERWEDSELFHRFYEPVAENETRKLYKVNEDALGRMLEEHGYNARAVPSLREDTKPWNAQTVYYDIRNEHL
ncbi:MAG: glycosyltransferase family 39 protein [Candidatus Wildermuthbacteria bacterium]|nr:glycosyltransferase family 39 protein [Candidatus Wildermuthbacteria bacterium]